MVEKKQVIEALKKVQDPELGIDVWTLGLVYNIAIKQSKVKIVMTLTSPMCPYGPMMVADVKNKVESIKGIKEAAVEVTFNPPWKPTEEVRELLGV